MMIQKLKPGFVNDAQQSIIAHMPTVVQVGYSNWNDRCEIEFFGSCQFDPSHKINLNKPTVFIIFKNLLF